MNGLCLLVSLILAETPTVDVATLAGEQFQGQLDSISADTVTIKSDTKTQSVSLSEVLLIKSVGQAAAKSAEAPIEIRLVDGTRLRVTQLTASSKSATAVHPQLGEMKLPVSNIASVRLNALDTKVDTDWKQLLERPMKKDALVVRKGDVLDHLDGIIGSISDTTLQFQMDGDDRAIKREKAFGLIFSKRDSTAKKAIAQLELASGDQLAIKQVSWDGAKWKSKLVSGLDIDISPAQFKSIDFSLGKVTYLSDLEPRSVKLTPFFDIPVSFPINEYRRDKNFDGSRISLGDKTYSKGLAIHSQTQMKYRLGGDYRRFQAVMGIGDEVPVGEVDVVLKGDGKTLFKGPVRATEVDGKGASQRCTPQALDVDVTGVNEFEIIVDFGNDQRDIGDRLYLANARAIK